MKWSVINRWDWAALFISRRFSCHHHDGPNSLVFDVPSCAGFLTHAEDAYAHAGRLMDLYGERFRRSYLSDGEIHCAHIYIHGHDKNGDILNMGNSIRDSRSKLLNMDSTNLQLLYIHQDRVRNMRLLQMKSV